MSDEAEEWRAVVGHEGSYEVSNLGRVKSLDRICSYSRRCQYSGKILLIDRKIRGALLAPGPSNYGHLTVVLGRNNTRLVHHLVLEAFVGPRPNGCECLHIDGNCKNNNVANLRWGTRTENVEDARRHGTLPIGVKKWNAKLTEEQVKKIKISVYRWGLYKELGRQFDVSDTSIRQVVSGRTWKHIEVNDVA